MGFVIGLFIIVVTLGALSGGISGYTGENK